MDSQKDIITVTLHQPSLNIPCGSFIAEFQAKFIIFYLFIYLFIYLFVVHLFCGRRDSGSETQHNSKLIEVCVSIDKVK